MAPDEVTTRLNRARSMDRPVTIVNHSPIIVEIETSDSDRRDHVLVPNIGYCSCEDRNYRQLPCKHLLYLALRGDDEEVPAHVSRVALSGIGHHAGEIADEIEELRERLSVLEPRYEAWSSALDELEPDSFGSLSTQTGEWSTEDREAWVERNLPTVSNRDPIEDWDLFFDGEDDPDEGDSVDEWLEAMGRADSARKNTGDEITEIARSARTQPE